MRFRNSNRTVFAGEMMKAVSRRVFNRKFSGYPWGLKEYSPRSIHVRLLVFQQI